MRTAAISSLILIFGFFLLGSSQEDRRVLNKQFSIDELHSIKRNQLREAAFFLQEMESSGFNPESLRGDVVYLQGRVGELGRADSGQPYFTLSAGQGQSIQCMVKEMEAIGWLSPGMEVWVAATYYGDAQLGTLVLERTAVIWPRS